MIPFHVIGTGSTGNGVIVGENILVDAGLPFVRFEPYMDSIKLVLLTHEHGDHFKPSTVRRMAHDKPLLRFGCGPWMVRKLVNAGVATSQIDVLNLQCHPRSCFSRRSKLRIQDSLSEWKGILRHGLWKSEWNCREKLFTLFDRK